MRGRRIGLGEGGARGDPRRTIRHEFDGGIEADRHLAESHYKEQGHDRIGDAVGATGPFSLEFVNLVHTREMHPAHVLDSSILIFL